MLFNCSRLSSAHSGSVLSSLNRFHADEQIAAVGLERFFDPFAEDSQLNVYAGEAEVRPPGAPTTGPDRQEHGPYVAFVVSLARRAGALGKRRLQRVIIVSRTAERLNVDCPGR